MSFKVLSSKATSKSAKPPEPIAWGSPPGYGHFSAKELALIWLLSHAQKEEGGPWNCMRCKARYERSSELLTHLVTDKKCRKYQEFEELDVVQTLIVLAAVDWQGIYGTVESYVGLWERDELEISDVENITYYETEEEDIDGELSDANSLSPPPSKPQAPLPITRKRKRKDSLDTSRPLNPLPTITPGNEIIRSKQAPFNGKSHARLPDHHPNFYDALYNNYIYHAPTSPAISIDVLLKNKHFPLQPPTTLHHADQEKYKKLLERLKIYTSHRSNYLKVNTTVIGRKAQLLADWNADDTVNVVDGKKQIYKTFDSWDTRRFHDTKKLRALLRSAASSSPLSFFRLSPTSTLLAPTADLSAPSSTLQASASALPASVSSLPASATAIPASVSTLPASATTMPASATNLPAPTTTFPAPASAFTFSTFHTSFPAPTTTLPPPAYVPTFGAPSLPLASSDSASTPPVRGPQSVFPPRALPFTLPASTTTLSSSALPFALPAPTYNFHLPRPTPLPHAPVPKQAPVTAPIISSAPSSSSSFPRPASGFFQRIPVLIQDPVVGPVIQYKTLHIRHKRQDGNGVMNPEREQELEYEVLDDEVAMNRRSGVREGPMEVIEID